MTTKKHITLNEEAARIIRETLEAARFEFTVLEPHLTAPFVANSRALKDRCAAALAVLNASPMSVTGNLPEVIEDKGERP